MASKEPPTTSSKDVQSGDPPGKQGTKHGAVTIFIILGVVLIIYVIYCFEAYKNNWFPFQLFVQEVPDNAVRPLGDVTPVDSDTLNRIQASLQDVCDIYCSFYADRQVTISLPGNNLPPCKC